MLVKSDVKLPSHVFKWKKDLDRTIENSEWSAIWSSIKSFSPNIETVYKVLSRWYLVPVTIAEFAPDHSGLCFHGCSEHGTYIHMWWNCSFIQKFGKNVFHLPQMFESTIAPDPEWALLNIKPDFLTQTVQVVHTTFDCCKTDDG